MTADSLGFRNVNERWKCGVDLTYQVEKSKVLRESGGKRGSSAWNRFMEKIVDPYVTYPDPYDQPHVDGVAGPEELHWIQRDIDENGIGSDSAIERMEAFVEVCIGRAASSELGLAA